MARVTVRVTVLGAGIIGLCVADELLRRGHLVTVVDPTPGRGASYAAAGMLSPGGEAWHGEDALLRLGLESLALWPAYAERLGVPLHAGGTLLAAADAGDLQEISRQVDLLSDVGVAVEPLSRRDLLAREPGLGRVVGGAHLPDERSIDPRAVVAALLARIPVQPAPDSDADVTVIATGAALPEPYAGLARPVRGDILRLCTDDPPQRTLRARVHGEQVYLVPRDPVDGVAEVVVGATSEERTGPPEPSAEGVWRLLDTARRIFPGLDRATLADVVARDRPGTPDNRPLVGPTDEPGVLLAAGAYRNGVLLAPLLARLIADHLDHGEVDPDTDPRRFGSTTDEGER